MASKRSDVRPKVSVQSSAGTGYRYITQENRRNTPGRLELRKYDPIVRRHVVFKEIR